MRAQPSFPASRRNLLKRLALFLGFAISSGWQAFPAEPAEDEWDRTFQAELPPNAGVVSLLVQPDDRILVAAQFPEPGTKANFSLVRLRSDGARDREFVNPLTLLTNELPWLRPLALDASGKVLCQLVSHDAGCEQRTLIRLLGNGIPDPSFSSLPLTAGNGLWSIYTVAPQADGGLFIGGHLPGLQGQLEAGLARVREDGTLDTTFQAAARVPLNSVTDVQPDSAGRLLVLGHLPRLTNPDDYQPRLFRLLADGAPDPAFPVWPPVDSFFPQAAKPLTNGGIELRGAFRGEAGAIAGSVVLDAGGALLRQRRFHLAPLLGIAARIELSGGRSLVHGGFTSADAIPRPGLARFQADGSLDEAFDPSPFVGTTYSVGHQIDGGIIVAVSRPGPRLPSGTSLIRLHPGDVKPRAPEFAVQPAGAAKLEDEPQGLSLSILSQAHAAFQWFKGGTPLAAATNTTLVLSNLVRSDAGDYYAVVTSAHGSVTSQVAQVTVANRPGTLGALDLRFRPGSLEVSAVSDEFWFADQLVLQPDGRPLVAGRFYVAGSENVYGLARLLPDGTWDSSFQPAGGDYLGVVRALALDAGGRVLVGMGGEREPALVRLLSNGQLDSTFRPQIQRQAAAAEIRAVLPLADGRILVGGLFDSVGQRSENALALLDSTGMPDAAFVARGFAGTSNELAQVTALAQSPGGSFLVGGHLKVGTSAGNLCLLLVDQQGTVQRRLMTALAGSVSTAGAIHRIIPRLDGSMVVAGSFSSVNGRSRKHLVRLLPDGVVDPNFDATAALTSATRVTALDQDSAGRLLVGGPGQGQGFVIGLNADGTRDSSFLPATFPGGHHPGVRAIRAGNGRVWVAGGISWPNGNARFLMAACLYGELEPGSLELVPGKTPAHSSNLRIFSHVNRHYHLLVTDRLNAQDWRLVGAAAGTGGTIALEDAEAGTTQSRFYRVIIE